MLTGKRLGLVVFFALLAVLAWWVSRPLPGGGVARFGGRKALPLRRIRRGRGGRGSSERGGRFFYEESGPRFGENGRGRWRGGDYWAGGLNWGSSQEQGGDWPYYAGWEGPPTCANCASCHARGDECHPKCDECV